MTQIITDVVYFDWNVISYLTKPEGLNGDLKDSCEAVATLIDKLIDRDKCIFPLSYAHFRDIQQGGPNYVTLDLRHLGDFTRNWMVYENIPHDFNLKLSQRPDLTFDYDYYIANTISTPVRLPFFTRVLIFSVNIFFRLTGLFFPARQRDLFRRLANCIQNFESSGLETLRLNKDMRSGLAEVYGRRIEYPNIHKQKRKTPQDIKAAVDACISQSMFSVWKSHEDFFRVINFDYLTNLSPFHRKVLQLTSLADFIALVSEKVNSPTAFESLTNDQLHLALGLQCHIFVTADKRLLQKANFIKNWLELPVHVFDIDGFAKFLLRQVYLKDHPHQTTGSFRCTVNSNGRKIKDYEIDLSW